MAKTEEEITRAKEGVAQARADKEKLLSDQAYTLREKDVQDRIKLATEEEKEAGKISEVAKKEAIKELEGKNRDSVKLLETDLKDTLRVTNDKYAQLSSADQLAASAKRLLVSSTEAGIIAILESYNPQYAAAGKSAGELMMQGLDDAIEDGKEDLEKTIDGLIELLKIKKEDIKNIPTPTAPAAATAPAVENFTQNNEFNFNQPTPTPSQNAQAVADAARGLA